MTIGAASRADGHARGATRQAEREPFGQHMHRDEPAPARAERDADRELLLPAQRSGEQQVSDVGARDEQHEPGRGQQQDRAGGGYRRRAHRAGSGPRSGCRGSSSVLAFPHLLRDPGQLRLRTFARHARLPADPIP